MKYKEIKKDIINNKLKFFLIIGFLIIITFIFFYINYYIPFDGSQYYYMSLILDGKIAVEYWFGARGIIFPLYILVITKIFGETHIGMLVMLYIPFILTNLILLFIIYKFLKDKKNKRYFYLYYICYILFIGINLFVLGYSHTLLTEIWAPFLFTLNLLINYKWYSVNTTDNYKKYLYVLYFSVSCIICFHLKQTYLFISILPLFITAFARIIKSFKIKNIIYSCIVLIVPTFLVFYTNNLWNKNFIENNNIKNVYEEYLNGTFTKVLSKYYKVINNPDLMFINKIDISKKDKEKVIKLIKNDNYKSFSLLKVIDNKKEYYIVYFHQNGENVVSSFTFLISQIFKHPRVVFKGLWDNYCYISGFKNFNSDDDKYGIYINENRTIATFPLATSGGVWWQHYQDNEIKEFDDLLVSSTKVFVTKDITKNFNKNYAKISFGLYSISYMIIMILIPFLGVYYFIRFIIKKDGYNLFLMLIYLSSFIHLLFRIVNASYVDRYMYPYYVLCLLGLIIMIINKLNKKPKFH